MRSSRRWLACLAVLGGLLAGCAGTQNGEEAEYVARPVEDLYNEALALLDEGNEEAAAEAFEEVERQHPYSQWATRSMFMAAYAYYETSLYDDAIFAAQRFVDLHPGNENVPYALYLQGLSYYERISDVRRDQEMTEQARGVFQELVARFPETDYARDARLKLDLVTDHLAGKEMEIGRYYLDRQQYLAAINRFRTVVEEYQTTTHVPEALHRLTEAYLALGVREEARASAAVLGHNFPGSEWYARSYALLEGEGLEAEPADGGAWFSWLM